MNLRNTTSLTFFAALMMTAGHLYAGDGWTSYRAKSYGLEMPIPDGARVTEKEAAGGWGGMYAQHDGVEFYGLAKLGEKASADEIAAFAVKETGIGEDRWEQVDQGAGHGWQWYKIYRARQGSKIVFGASGVGPKGSYLVFVRTSKSDYDAHRKDYQAWAQKLRLF